jgi:hypothetical protein
MPKITSGGVSDKAVHPDYIAPPGVAPEVALDLGLPDAGQAEDAEEQEEESSPGKTSSPGSKQHEPQEPKQNDAGKTRSTARSTAGRSNGTRKGSTTASSEDT